MSIELEEAYQKGNDQRAREIFMSIKKLDQQYSSGQTPLGIAVWYGDKEMVEYLLSKGADVNFTTSHGSTPLIYAVTRTDLLRLPNEIVDLLISKGADVNMTDNDKEIPLMRALFNQAPQSVIKSLLDHGTNVNHRDRWKRTPLMRAAEKCNFWAVERLIELGADVNAKDEDGQTALFMALNSSCGLKDKDKVVDLLHSKGSIKH